MSETGSLSNPHETPQDQPDFSHATPLATDELSLGLSPEMEKLMQLVEKMKTEQQTQTPEEPQDEQKIESHHETLIAEGKQQESETFSLDESPELQQLIQTVETAENIQPEIDKLVGKLNELFLTELGEAEYDDLPPSTIRNGKIFMSLYDKPALALEFAKKTAANSTMLDKFATTITEILKRKLVVESNFCIYADLNLDGANDEIRKASRFAHLIFAESDEHDFLNHDPQDLAKNLEQVFTDPELKFKWIAKDGTTTSDDPRVDQLDFTKIQVLDYKEGADIQVPPNSELTPLIIRIHDAVGEEQLSNPTLLTSLQHLIDTHPFVVMVSEPPTSDADKNGKKKYLFNILGNHQYLDGVPAAYYLNTLIKQSGMNSVMLQDLDRETLENTFKMTDRRENILAPDDRYDIESVVLSDEIFETFAQLYEKVAEVWKKNGVMLSDKDFFQLALFNYQHINGESRRAGVLKFDAHITEQLGHYDVGDAEALFKSLCNASAGRETLEQVGANFRQNFRKGATDEVLDLYPDDKNNVHNIIGSLTDSAPQWAWPYINELTKKLKILDYIIGQSMSSIVPEQVSVRYSDTGPSTKIQLGGGCGGPACTETQQWCSTAALQEKRGVVRMKRRKARTNKTLHSSNSI